MRSTILFLVLTLCVGCASRRPMSDADRESIARMGQAFGNYQATPATPTATRKTQTVCQTYKVGYAYQTYCREQ